MRGSNPLSFPIELALKETRNCRFRSYDLWVMGPARFLCAKSRFVQKGRTGIRTPDLLHPKQESYP